MIRYTEVWETKLLTKVNRVSGVPIHYDYLLKQKISIAKEMVIRKIFFPVS